MAEKPTAKQIVAALRQQHFELGLAPKYERMRAVLETAIDHIDHIEANAGLTSADVPWLPAGDHHVIVVERDTREAPTYTWDAYGIPEKIEPFISRENGPITWEHYLGAHTSRDEIAKRCDSFGADYGRKAIAKLVIVRADL